MPLLPMVEHSSRLPVWRHRIFIFSFIRLSSLQTSDGALYNEKHCVIATPSGDFETACSSPTLWLAEPPWYLFACCMLFNAIAYRKSVDVYELLDALSYNGLLILSFHSLIVWPRQPNHAGSAVNMESTLLVLGILGWNRHWPLYDILHILGRAEQSTNLWLAMTRQWATANDGWRFPYQSQLLWWLDPRVY